MLNDISSWGIPITMFMGTIGLVWSAAWFLSNRLSESKREVFNRIEKLQETLLDKLEYHERHDDQRFRDVTNDIWTIRVRNAAVDKDPV